MGYHVRLGDVDRTNRSTCHGKGAERGMAPRAGIIVRQAQAMNSDVVERAHPMIETQ